MYIFITYILLYAYTYIYTCTWYMYMYTTCTCRLAESPFIYMYIMYDVHVHVHGILHTSATCTCTCACTCISFNKIIFFYSRAFYLLLQMYNNFNFWLSLTSTPSFQTPGNSGPSYPTTDQTWLQFLILVDPSHQLKSQSSVVYFYHIK